MKSKISPKVATGPALVAALVGAIALLYAASALAQADKPSAADRAIVSACLALANKNLATEEAKPGYPLSEAYGAEERLKTATDDASTDPSSCVGAIYNACTSVPEGESTLGMEDCSDRELAVWDERLNAGYKTALDGEDAKTKAVLLQVQRAWIAYRDATCSLPALDDAGGSIVGPETEDCLMRETARQALWYDQRNK